MVQPFDELREAGYTDLLVFAAQQIQHFRRLGKEFAMKHSGSEDEMIQYLLAILASLPLEERLKCLSTEEGVEGFSPEELFKGLTLEQREQMQELLQQQTKADDNAAPK